MSQLHVVEGPLRGKVFEVNGPASIGRGEACAVRLDGRHISRVHARIERRGNDLVIVDSGSRNGIFVNGQPVKETALRPDDQVEIGEHVLVFDPTGDPRNRPRVVTTILEGLADPFAPGGEPDPRLPQLLGVAAAVTAADDPKEIARMLLEACMTAASAERGIVMVLDAEGRLRPAARKAAAGEEEFYLSNVLHHEVAKQRRAVIATDAARRAGAGKRVGILCVPLTARKNFVGLLYAESRLPEGQERPAFRTIDLRFAAALAAFAGARIGQIRRHGARALVGEKPLAVVMAAFEKECLVEALRLREGDLDHAARLLGIGRSDLEGKIKQHGLAAAPPPEPPPPLDWKSVRT